MSPTTVGGHLVPGIPGLYWRKFTRGSVFMNVNTTGTVNYTADRAYQTLDAQTAYAPGSLIPIPAQSALFLNLGSGGVPTNINPPVITSSGGAFVGDVLTLSSGETTNDWTGSPTSYTQQWQRVNPANQAVTDIAGQTGTTHTLVAADKTFRVRCRVRAVNASGTSPDAFSNLTAVVADPAGSIPVNFQLPTVREAIGFGLATNPVVGDVVYTDQGGFTNNPTSIAVQWQRDTSDIVGETNQNYLVQAADIGHTIRVVTIAHNSAGDSAPATSLPSGTVAATNAPTNTSPPTVSAPIWEEGFVATADDGDWTGTGITYTRIWQRADPAGTVTTIPGETGQTYTMVHADVGYRVRVITTATNTAGNSSATSQFSPQIIAAPPGPKPQNTSPPVITSTAFQVGGIVTTTDGVWTGATNPFTYEWIRVSADGSSFAVISGQTQNTYTLTQSDVGSVVESRVTASNQNGSVQQISGSSPVIVASGGSGGSSGGGSGVVTISSDLQRIEIRLDQRGLQ